MINVCSLFFFFISLYFSQFDWGLSGKSQVGNSVSLMDSEMTRERRDLESVHTKRNLYQTCIQKDLRKCRRIAYRGSVTQVKRKYCVKKNCMKKLDQQACFRVSLHVDGHSSANSHFKPHPVQCFSTIC